MIFLNDRANLNCAHIAQKWGDRERGRTFSILRAFAFDTLCLPPGHPGSADPAPDGRHLISVQSGRSYRTGILPSQWAGIGPDNPAETCDYLIILRARELPGIAPVCRPASGMSIPEVFAY